MWSLDRRVGAVIALIALASLAGIAPAEARGERNGREMHEHRQPEGQRQAARREPVVRQNQRAYAAREQSAHAAQRREASYAPRAQPGRPAPNREASYTRRQPAANPQRQRFDRSREWHPAQASAARETHPAAGVRAREFSQTSAGGQARVVRYGNALSGTVERTIRPGLTSRTFVSGGHVLYTHIYQQHVWHQYGRAFAYETFVPAVRYPGVYYAWALAPWPRPIVYAWGWQVQPWYLVYGARFTPYPVYTSPDLWMTDYIIAQNMQLAYQAQTPVPPPVPAPQAAPAAPAPDAAVAAPAPQPGEPAVQPGDASSAPQLNTAPPPPQPSETQSAPAAPPPAITPQVKAELNAQIKVQLQEQQAAAAVPATLTTQSSPPALRPNHLFFGVVQPLVVPTANGHCSLSANDYIKRTGGMSDDDWKVPVVVELSRPSDCPEGLATRIGLNDLNAMENEQEAQVLEAMQAASKGMGPNGPPSGPGERPALIADGSAAPDPGALEAIRQAR